MRPVEKEVNQQHTLEKLMQKIILLISKHKMVQGEKIHRETATLFHDIHQFKKLICSNRP